jgi:D-lactate dehydrogenase
MHDVFLYETFEEEKAAIAQYCPPEINAGYTWKTIQESGHTKPPAPIISLRTQSVIPPAWADKLTAILSRSAGYDHLARYQQETEADIQYGYLPVYCVQAVAEQAMLLWMALLRNLPRQVQQFKQFRRDGLTGSECRGKTLVVTGVGNIGHQIVQLGKALGMTVFGVDIDPRHDDVDYLNIAEALPRADIIVCAMNLTADNPNYFSYDRMQAVSPGTLFINIARGELAYTADLLRLLDEGRLGGIGIDVYNRESELSVMLRDNRQQSGHPEVQAVLELRRRDHVIMTPHNAFNTAEAVQRKASQSIEQLQHLKQHGTFHWSAPI